MRTQKCRRRRQRDPTANMATAHCLHEIVLCFFVSFVSHFIFRFFCFALRFVFGSKENARSLRLIPIGIIRTAAIHTPHNANGIQTFQLTSAFRRCCFSLIFIILFFALAAVLLSDLLRLIAFAIGLCR